MSWFVTVDHPRLIPSTNSIRQDEATGITHHLVPGDFAFFHVGSKVKVSDVFLMLYPFKLRAKKYFLYS